MEGASGLHHIKSRYSADGGMKASRADVVEQWARQSSGHAQRLASSSSIQRRGSDSLGKSGNLTSRLEKTASLKQKSFIFRQ